MKPFIRAKLALAFLLSSGALAAVASAQEGAEATPYDWRGNNTCAVCHEESKYTHRYPNIEVGDADLKDTVHSQFACLDCHYVGYDDYPHNKIVHRVNCSECHEDQRHEYEKSSHFKALSEGNLEAPKCVDCHGFHDIQQPSVQLSGQAAIDMCAQCHADEALTSQFQLKPDVLQSFSTSYHGGMYKLGFEGDDYATCVSCHSNHAIMGKDDPESTINAANIVKTCAACHDDATEEFASYLTHWSAGDGQNKVLDGAFHGLEALIWGVMIFFGLHTLLWFLHTLLTKGQVGSFKPSRPDAETKIVRRFTSVQRIMHIVLAVSFLTLALTGLPVKFSDSESSQWIAQNLIGFQSAALLHRIAGIILGTLFLGHAGHILWRVIKKKDYGMLWGPTSMVPNMKDLTDFVQHIKFFLFLRKSPPKFDRWTYWEKFDYFAVFWGMFIIGGSGLMLMLPYGTTALLPGWSLNLAKVVHSEEALLATAFIFTIHFFNTHLRPNAFPLDDVVFTGRMTLERLEEERPAEYERLKEAGELEDLFVEPLAPWKVMALRAVGLCLLLVGLALLFLILS